MNDSQEKHIAAQALKALQLRRQFERGALTQQDYLDQLNALQGTPASAAGAPRTIAEPSREPGDSQSRPEVSEPRKLIGALALLQLRRRLDKGELTSQEYLAQLSAGPEREQSAPEPTPPQPATPAVPPLRLKGPPVSMTQASPERSLAMKCIRCATDLRIYDQTTELECLDCGAAMVVERKDCTIALRLVKELPELPDPNEAATASRITEAALKKLRSEAAMVTNVKRSAGILGGLCGLLFAYMGIADMAARNVAMGTSIFVCGSALLGTVVCITRQTTKVRAELTARIDAILAGEGSAAKLG